MDAITIKISAAKRERESKCASKNAIANRPALFLFGGRACTTYNIRCNVFCTYAMPNPSRASAASEAWVLKRIPVV